MRRVIALSLFFVMLFVAGYAYASPYQSCECSPVASQSVACPNPEIVTLTTSRPVFSNPHSGWLNVPVEETFLRCPAHL